jgi:hypothetical protein
MSGKIFYGSSPDGSDAKEFEGVYINPNNPNEWSNTSYKITRSLPKQKEWICKGKHQYRQVLEKGEGHTISTWICQCGKKL